MSTVVCGGEDISVKVTTITAFKNVSGAGNYEVSQIKVENIPTRCNGNVFTLKAWGQTGGELPLYQKTNSTSEKYYSVDVLASGGVFSIVTGLDTAIEAATFISSGFSLLCTEVTAAPSLGNTTRTISVVNNSPEISKACPTGKVMIGTVVASGQYIADMAPVCADFPTKSNPVTGNMYGQVTNGRSTCPKDTWGVGFSGSFGSGIDRMALVCRKLA